MTALNNSNILEKILEININKIDVSSNLYTDTQIDEWITNKAELKGTKIILNNIIKSPINNKELLLNRQKCNINITDDDKEILKKYENDVLWLYKIDEEIKENVSINTLYPSTYIIKNLNNIDIFLNFYHLYKIFLIPLMALISPISIIYGPYYYLHKYLKISLREFLNTFINLLKVFFRRTNNLKNDIIKLATIIAYIVLYIYNIYQTFEYSYLIYKTRDNLINKMNGLCLFINTSLKIINTTNENLWKPYYIYDTILNNNFIIKNNTSYIYKLWKNEKIKEEITNILKTIYTIDVVNTITTIKNNNNWCIVNYSNETKLWGMKNPLLNDNQISNPIYLNKNIIITGPNAGGKTTYVKTFATNIILSQTLGICLATKANIILYDSIKTFMRISDILGTSSYFEAESEHCLNIINTAIKLSNDNKQGLFLLDEPMHSTPPTEGMSLAYGVCEYISKLKNIKIIITTHFHRLIDLELNYPDKFINLFVDAEYDELNKKYLFNYKINKGFSKKCIAIELLNTKKYPIEIINSAIKMKNKICNENYSK